MGENNKFDCWGLSLSLKPPITNPDPISTPTDKQIPNLEKPQSTSIMLMSKIIGVDIKPTPLVIDLAKVEETAKNFSPNSSLLSNATGNKKLCGRNMINVADGGSNGGSRGGTGGREERKKLRLSKEQIMVLEQAFREHMTLNTKQKIALARQVNLRPRQVEVWFQNRRARTKLKQTEVECEQLRRFCETLTEENRKLHKEVQQLRTLKTSSGLTQHASDPPSTLTMCPSCKTISTTAKTSTTDAGPRLPLSLTQFSLTINNNRLFKSHLSQA